MEQELLREIPQVDALLRDPALAGLFNTQGHTAVVHAARSELERVRSAVLRGEHPDLTHSALCDAVKNRVTSEKSPLLHRVINATGVALHTNLGRAPLAESACAAVQIAAGGYTNLEYNLTAGTRGSRGALVEPLLCELCGCEAALVVNNNAAALLLALWTFARGREIVLSRGELVEIGDGFRVPEIMAQSGGRLTEVGSTNRTHPDDYERAINAGDAGLLLKVHTSNFKVVGFTASVSVRTLAEIAARHQIPLLVDLGSGVILETKENPFPEEPTVLQTLRDGADLVCFSGDKLLGGPQSGILLGKAKYIEEMRRNPLTRALRADKLTLAALSETLRLYRDPARAKREIPVLRMLCADLEDLQRRAQTLCGMILQSGADCSAETIPTKHPVGGGSAPAYELTGYAVAVCPCSVGINTLERRLRDAAVPVIARLSGGRLLLDISTVTDEQFPLVTDAVKEGCMQ